LLYRVLTAQLLCGVVQLCDRLSVERWSGRSTPFTVTIPVTNGPLGAVVGGQDTPRRLAHRTGFRSAAAVSWTCVSRVPVCEPR